MQTSSPSDGVLLLVGKSTAHIARRTATATCNMAAGRNMLDRGSCDGVGVGVGASPFQRLFTPSILLLSLLPS
jgi:hypothetical protein